MLITQTYSLTQEQREAISHSFGETGLAGYVVAEQFLRDVVRSVLDSLVADMQAAHAPATSPVRVRKRPRTGAE